MTHKLKDCFVFLDAKKYRFADPKGSNTCTGTQNNNNNRRAHHHNQHSTGNSNTGEEKEEVMESHHAARVGWQLPSDGEEDGMFAECNLGDFSLRNEFANRLLFSSNAADMLSSATSTEIQNEFQYEVGLERLTFRQCIIETQWQCIIETQQQSWSTSFLVYSAENPPAVLDHSPNGDTKRDCSPSSVAQFGLI
jgi:hypothetical protein